MLLLDTSFLVALANERDAHHEAARRLQAEIDEGRWRSVLLPEYVFLETVTVLMARRDIRFARQFGESLLRAREVDLVPSSQHFLDTWASFRGQEEGTLSFADANIAVIAESRDVDEVATFDEGFDALDDLERVP